MLHKNQTKSQTGKKKTTNRSSETPNEKCITMTCMWCISWCSGKIMSNLRLMRGLVWETDSAGMKHSTNLTPLLRPSLGTKTLFVNFNRHWRILWTSYIQEQVLARWVHWQPSVAFKIKYPIEGFVCVLAPTHLLEWMHLDVNLGILVKRSRTLHFPRHIWDFVFFFALLWGRSA